MLRSVRSAVSSPRVGASISATTVPGATRPPSATRISTSNSSAMTSSSVQRMASPAAMTPSTREVTVARDRCAGPTVASDVTSGP